MLIRLCGHFLDNPNHIDKLIAIKGLPSEWFFRKSKWGTELVKPWQPDVEANIPQSIRHLCETFDIVEVFPPIEKGRDTVVDNLTIIGVKLDFMTELGQTMWAQVERYLDRMTPRDKPIPKPVLVAPNQKSDFNPHLARRTVRGSLELTPSEIPDVDLRTPETILVSQPAPTEALAVAAPVEKPAPPAPLHQAVVCPECRKSIKSGAGLRLHMGLVHKKKAAVAV